jgi:hypothetical protein
MRADQIDFYHSDGIHTNIGSDNGELVATTDFDYSEIDRGCFDHEEQPDSVSFSDMSAALSLILGWVCASPNLTHCGGRAAALLWMLDVTNAPHGRDNLTKIAKELSCLVMSL